MSVREPKARGNLLQRRMIRKMVYNIEYAKDSMLIGAGKGITFVLEIATSLSLLAMTRLFVTAHINYHLL